MASCGCNPWDNSPSVSEVCGNFDPNPADPDQGCCTTPPVKTSCSAPALPLTGFPSTCSYDPDNPDPFSIL